MRNPTSPPTRIAVAYHPDLPVAAEESVRVCHALGEFGITERACASLYDEAFRARVQAREFDVMIALGGDGTMLRAGRLCAPLGLPVMGINMGHFGFLIEVQRNNWREALPLLLAGKFWLEDRTMLHVEHWRNENRLGCWEAINDVVVTRGSYVRPIQVSARVDDYLLTDYTADGLIAATATGSTAYAMAVGGPVMPPELRNILIIPVAPHLSMDRAIILAEGNSVVITVQTNHEAVLSVDGALPVAMLAGDTVRASTGEFQVSFIRFQDPGYFYRNLAQYMQRNPTTGGNTS